MTLPLAYFITFRTYGTWLHGDARGSIHRRPGPWPSALGPMPRLERVMEDSLAGSPVRLDPERRAVVAAAIQATCAIREWRLHSLAVRCEHVHVLVTSVASIPPEAIMVSLKAWSTRRLVESGLVSRGGRVWSRHGSTKHVFTLGELEAVIHYIENQ